MHQLEDHASGRPCVSRCPWSGDAAGAPWRTCSRSGWSSAGGSSVRPGSRRRSAARRDPSRGTRSPWGTWPRRWPGTSRTPRSASARVGGHPDVVNLLLGLGLQPLGQLVEHVGRLVDPAALLARRRDRPAAVPSKSPRAPSPVASFGSTTRPRDFTSKSSPFHDCSLSRKPSTTAINSLRPSAVAPINTRMHCRSSSRRMLKCTPSAHR